MTLITKDRVSHIQRTDFDEKRFDRFFNEIIEDSAKEYPQEKLDTIRENIKEYVYSKEEVSAEKLFSLIVRESNEFISKKSPQFSYLSASAFRRMLYKKASQNRGFDYKNGYGDYYSFVVQMVEQGHYDESLLTQYSEREIRRAGKLIKMERDKLFSYAGLFLMKSGYLKKGYNGDILELPQERFLTTALYLMKNENKNKRMEHVKEAYWAISKHYVGLATPTLMSSGSPHGTLSSCHIITPDDDLISIFKSLEHTARFSQNGAGIGTYLGYLRSKGSWIRGFKGRASGIVNPARLNSVLAEYVNQLGNRVAGIALYLPVWHYDVFDFLELRLKTGSQEKRAHTIKTAVTMPDEYYRRLDKKGTWTLFDPYEVRKKLNIDLNRLYDKKKLRDGETPNPEDHAFTYHYRIAEQSSEIEIKNVVNATDIYKAIFISRKTGGVPYLYNHDTSARLNPNGHKGMPMGSNLCSEIIQNMSVDRHISEGLDEDGFVITKVESGDLVTCNLNSLVLQNVFGEEEVDLQRVVNIQFRMLDNVISLDRTVVPQATQTNRRYRAVGAGALGLVTLLTTKGIRWESEEASVFTDGIFKKYLKAMIRASHTLAMEKGSYPYYEGSDWNTGEFFDKRNFVSDEWTEVREMAGKGMRNGYLGAIAPTSSNSIMMNGSPSIDPLYEVVYREEKSGLNVTIVPDNYNEETKWYYKSGFEMDEMWAINVVASAQKYIDQGISHNMHVLKNIKASEMIRLDMGAWKKGVKTIYYTYTEDYQREAGCEMCEA